MKSIFRFLFRIIAGLLLLAALVITVLSISPVYNFSDPQPFSGPDIYNPYEGVSGSWKKSCFHTHSKVDNILNECPEYASKVLEDYMQYGYDIVTFSNHSALTPHPTDSTLQVNVYEHGINIPKFHKLVFNPRKRHLFDHPFPILISQKQWQLDYLGKDSDFLVLNHPDRTLFNNAKTMRLLTGYRMMEGECGYDTDLIHWDEALSAGHYSHNLLSDDCHDSGNHVKIARRCTWLDTPSGRYEDIAPALVAGRFYSMRIPDFGDGDISAKRKGNASLPSVTGVDVRGDSIFVAFSEPAHIEAWGQDHKVLNVTDGTAACYVLGENEPYVRFAAGFGNGVRIYTNAFARYDASVADSPYVVSPHKVNVLLTILFNLGLLVILILLLVGLKAVLPHKKKETRPSVEELRFRGIVP